MVRRRARAIKTLVEPPTSDGGSISSANSGDSVDLLQSNNFDCVVVAPAAPNLEDQFFASPKRKDCKIDSVHVQNENKTDEDDDVVVISAVEASSGNTEVDDKMFEIQKSKVSSSSPGKTRADRNNSRTIGVPLATRSQTRTIENFFKANTAAKSAKIKSEIVDKQQPDSEDVYIGNKNFNNGIIDLKDIATPIKNGYSKFPIESANPFHRQHSADAPITQPELFFDLSEDTNDTDHTELSDEYSAASGGSSNVTAFGIANTSFETHRSTLRDSHSSRSSTTDNIFLQEPVLTLNVDKSLNQASSIKINKTLEIEPIFSSPPAITAALLNGRFNKVSLNGLSPSIRDSFGYDTQPITVNAINCYVLNMADNDNSSCDSGVAFGTNSAGSNNTFDINTPNPPIAAAAATRRRKPATPHRIVCPSPIKAAPRMISPATGTAASSVGTQYSPSGRKIAASKEQLSPRKSPRHLVAATASSKTRRRLNQMKEHKAPYQTINQIMQNGCRQNGHIVDNEANDDDNDDDDLEFENLDDDTASVAFCEAPPKMFLNQTQTKQNLTAQQQQQQQQTNRITNKSHKTKTVTTANAKIVRTVATTHQPKMKLLHQAPQPLAATNGNRELTSFFPVRRSVRKTKTAVKEEMMRNLEQAILEERSEGLKIAHFEGKGRGIIADRRFERGEFVIEYVGDLISMTEAAEREKHYALDENAGCYMYYFKHKNQQYCIDATIDTGKLGRLVNHSRNGNLITKVVVVKQRPHLILIAKDDIEPGEELTYDYGDRSKESLIHHPWLAF